MTVFEDLSKFTLDPYWISVFDDCAREKYPPGMRYNQQTRTVTIRTRETMVTTPYTLPQSPENIFKVMKRIMTEQLGMRSPRDLQLQKEEMQKSRDENVFDLNCEWKKIKQKSVKDQLILDFVTRQKELYSLTPSESKQLLTCINIGFQFHALTSSDVEYSDSTIINIEGLEFDEEKRIFTTRIQECPPPSTKVAKPKRKLKSEVEKFLKNNDQRVQKVTSAAAATSGRKRSATA